MAKEKVRHLSGVFASVFAHAGHISKEDAKEISGLKDDEFEKAYDKASSIAEGVMRHEGEKMDKFLEHLPGKLISVSSILAVSCLSRIDENAFVGPKAGLLSWIRRFSAGKGFGVAATAAP